ncbi:MAG: phosphoribosylglycinamide formyltransferase, partial [Planctomycetes bacterium]|nr:phosphoribosylglycinamide formyltransferase [Planctomycetota bacterium]
AGYMHLWKLDERLVGKVMNTHPALIPAFSGKGMYGAHVHRAVIAKGARISGCTVHLVDGQYDHGPILEQRSVVVEFCDTPESLAVKIQALEKPLLIQVIRDWPRYRKFACTNDSH